MLPLDGETASPVSGRWTIEQAHRIGSCCWGLVNGRTQTIYPWDSWWIDYTGESDPWFHDVFRPNGDPCRGAEAALIRTMVDSVTP